MLKKKNTKQNLEKCNIIYHGFELNIPHNKSVIFMSPTILLIYICQKVNKRIKRCPIKTNSDFLLQQSEITGLYHRQSIDNIYRKGLFGSESNYLSKGKLKSSSAL